MAEAKKGGFHALEQRIHQIEEEDAKQDTTRRAVQQPESGASRGESHEEAPRGTPAGKK